MEHESDDDNIDVCTFWMVSKSLKRRLVKNRDHSEHRIVKIVNNTEKSLRDQETLAVAQSPVKDLCPTLQWKSRKEWNNNNNNKVTVSARSSLSTSHRLSLSSIAPSWSSRLYSVSAQSWCKCLLLGQYWQVRVCGVVNKETSLMS